MSSKTWSRLYQEGDEDTILNILKTVFPYWHKHPDPLAYWLWRYQDSPIHKNIIALGYVDEKPVGVSHNNSLMVKLNQETSLGYLVGAAAVLPDYQGKGVYNKIRGLHNKIRDEKGSVFNYWITENPILIESDKRRGDYSFPFKINQYVKINDLDTYFNTHNANNKFVKKIAYQVASKIQKIGNKDDRAENSTIETQIINSFPPEINEFWEKTKDYYSFIFERNQEYLNWRYCDKRGGDYRIFIAYASNEIVGFLVSRIKNLNGKSECTIVDYLTLPGMENVFSELLKVASSHYQEEKINRISCWVVEGNTSEKRLPKAGFVHDRTNRYFGCNINETELETLKKTKPNHIHLVYGDIETL